MFAARNMFLVRPSVAATLAIVGTPNASTTTSCPIGTHQALDDIYVFGYNTSLGTAPTVATAGGTVPSWASVDSGNGNSNAARAVHFVANNNNHTTGTWTNVTHMITVVLRNQNASPIGGFASGSGASSTSEVAPSVTMSNTTGTSILLHFTGHKAVTSLAAAPSGYTRQVASSDGLLCLNTKDVTTSDGAMTQTLTASNTGYFGHTVEILSA